MRPPQEPQHLTRTSKRLRRPDIGAAWDPVWDFDCARRAGMSGRNHGLTPVGYLRLTLRTQLYNSGELMKIASLILITLTCVFAFGQETSELATPPNGDAERAEVSQWIGPVRVSIEYHSPHVHNPANNDRTGHIWGELVHYGFVDEGFGPSQSTPWRAGANETTTIMLSDDVKVGGKDL